jgi:prevent-host-death family protein
MTATTLAAGEFKARCLSLLDEVAATGKALTITKHGRPVAQLVAMPPPQPLFGAMKGSVISAEAIVAPVDEAWDAEPRDDLA